jgi:predicted ester cyclase
VDHDDISPAQQRNLAALGTWIESYNAQDNEGLDGVVTEDFHLDDPATGTRIAGRAALGDIARQVAQIYPDRRITVAEMIPLGGSAVAMRGSWDGTAAADSPTGARRGDAIHHVESMLVEFIEGKISLMRIYR